jgi:hypothetical protein
VERYGHPYERPVLSSSVPVNEFKERVIDFFRRGYSGIKPKRFWTWKEIKAIGKEVKLNV